MNAAAKKTLLGPRLLFWLLLPLMGVSFVSQGLQLHSELNVGTDPVATAEAPAASVVLVNSAHLFAPPLRAAAPTVAPPNLALLACFVQSAPGRSVALIAVDRQRPRRVSVGEEVTRGVRLHAVEATRVVLAQDGQTLSLGLHRGRAAQ